jgi:putative methyltransferase (TIGR01177 family)
MGGSHLVIGSGWHPTLFHAEVKSLTNAKIISHSDRIVEINKTENLERSATVNQVLAPWHQGDILDYEERFEEWLNSVNLETKQSIAVKCTRHGEKTPAVRKIDIATKMGAFLFSRGFKIDLTSPKQVIEVIIEGELIFWGLPHFDSPPRTGWKDRVATVRPFFKPVSLDPRQARLMFNLCGQKAPLLDPMCGTGGILVEASLCGIQGIGVDLDPEMVAGTKKNITWCNGQAEVICGDATRLADLGISGIDSVCFDPPYGRNAWLSDKGVNFFSRVLNSINEVCNAGATMCCMLPASADGSSVIGGEYSVMEELFLKEGWKVGQYWFIPVHASLGRLLVRAKRLDAE